MGERCPVHGIPDCSPLLNGCSRLTAPDSREHYPTNAFESDGYECTCGKWHYWDEDPDA